MFLSSIQQRGGCNEIPLFRRNICSFHSGGCTAKPDTIQIDPYDPAKMDLKPVAAVISGDRHTGPFASGKALSPDANLKPLDAEPVKTIQIDTTHKIIEIAHGVKFSGALAIRTQSKAKGKAQPWCR